jgi:hypothetical protein
VSSKFGGVEKYTVFLFVLFVYFICLFCLFLLKKNLLCC